MGVKSSFKKGLSALLIGATTAFSTPAFSQERPPQAASVLQKSSLEETISTLLENSKYASDRSLIVTDSTLKFKTKDFKDSFGVGPLSSVMDYIFAIPGKLRRPAFMGLAHFGQRRPNYVDLNWRKFLSQHLIVGAYDGELNLLPDFVKFNEEVFDEFTERFDFKRFSQKPIFLMYKNGTEFLQDKVFYPDRGTLGVTSVLGTNEVATFFSGRREEFAHTNKHEFVHWFDIQRMAKLESEKGLGKFDILGKMDLWMVEGLAEYYSAGWSSTHEQIVRDLWHNGIFIPIEELPRFSGSFLTYTFGNFYTKFLEEKFGPGTALKIRDNIGDSKDMDDMFKRTTGHDMRELDLMARDYLENKFYDMKGRKDARKVLRNGFLVGADSGRFLTWGFGEGHIKLYMNKYDGNDLVSKKIAQDAEYGYESLFPLFTGSGIGIRGDKIVFSATDSGKDKLVVQRFKEEKDEFSLEDKIEMSFDSIETISSPQFMGKDRVMFVGTKDGYQDIYSYDLGTGKLAAITSDKKGIYGLDYSEKSNAIVFAREDEKTSNPNGIDYDINLYLLDMNDGKLKQLTSESTDETNPKFSPDGRLVVFQKEQDFVNNLYLYNRDKGIAVPMGQEIIGAESPHFLTDDKILLNTRRLLVPQVAVQEVKSLDELVKDSLEQKTSGGRGSFRISGNELLLNDTPAADEIRPKREGEDVSVIVSHNDKLYFLNKAAKEIKNPKEVPLPMKDRVKKFLDSIPDDEKFLRRNALIYDVQVSEDGTKAVVFLNNNFVDRKAFKDIGFELSEEVTPALFYLEKQSLLSKESKPSIMITSKELSLNETKPEVEFLMNNQVMMRSAVTGLRISDYSGKADAAAKLKELMSKEDINGNVAEFKVSKDKRFVALHYVDRHNVRSDDHAIVVYDSFAKSFKAVAKTKYLIDNVKFLDNGRLFFSEEDKEWIKFGSYNLRDDKPVARSFKKTGKVLLTNVAATNEDVLFSVRPWPGRTLPSLIRKVEKPESALYYTSFNESKFSSAGVKQLSSGKNYDNFLTLDDIIIYDESDVYGKRETKTVDEKTDVIRVARSKQSANAHAVVSDDKALYDVDVKGGKSKRIADLSLGFDVKSDKVLFSKPKDGLFNVFSYDIESGAVEQVTDNKFNSFRPVYANDAIYYEAEENGEVYLRKRKGAADERLPLVSPVTDLAYSSGSLQGKVLRKEKKPELAAKPRDYSYVEGVKGEEKFSEWPIHDRRGSILAAWAGSKWGSGFLVQLDYVGFNELKTKVLAANLIWAKGVYGMGDWGYFDLAKDYSVRGNLAQFGYNTDVGMSAVKSFPFNAYLGAEFFGGLNYQDYPNYGGGYVRNNVYPTVGAAISYDDTVFDYLRGPREGTRGYLSLEAGYGLNTGKLNNVDANFDLRNYIPLYGRFGVSHRFMAGTSQGDNFHMFLLGGNVSMRGVPFDYMHGQNYAVSNLDLKIPIFEAAGVVLPGTDYLMPFLSAFDVRGGLYYDIGKVWYNRDYYNKNTRGHHFAQSFGIDINAIMFGSFIVRYNKGLIGKRDWNLWFGYSP